MLQAYPEASLAFTDEWLIDPDGARLIANTENTSRLYKRAGLAAGLCHDTPLLAVQQAMGIGDLKTNVQKSRDAIAMWEACQFSGSAGELRKANSAQAYLSLSRTLLLNDDLLQARRSVAVAQRIVPTSPRTFLLDALLYLPPPIVQAIMRRKFKINTARFM